MRITITKTSPSSCTVTSEKCCQALADAINFCFIDAEWNEFTGGLRLWVNPDIQVYEWLVEEYGEPKIKEMSIKFCPFCGEAVEWMQLPVLPVWLLDVPGDGEDCLVAPGAGGGAPRIKE